MSNYKAAQHSITKLRNLIFTKLRKIITNLRRNHKSAQKITNLRKNYKSAHNNNQTKSVGNSSIFILFIFLLPPPPLYIVILKKFLEVFRDQAPL